MLEDSVNYRGGQTGAEVMRREMERAGEEKGWSISEYKMCRTARERTCRPVLKVGLTSWPPNRCLCARGKSWLRVETGPSRGSSDGEAEQSSLWTKTRLLRGAGMEGFKEK